MLSHMLKSTSVRLFIVFVLLSFILLIYKEVYDQTHSATGRPYFFLETPHILNSTWSRDFGLMRMRDRPKSADQEHRDVVRKFIEKRKSQNFTYSKLGEVLFLNAKRPPPRNKTYKILMHKVGEEEEDRMLYYYGGTKHDPFEYCDVNNCKLTYEDKDFDDADAIIFHLHTLTKETNPPMDAPRPPGQRWIFVSDESPHSTFIMQNNDWFNYSNVFNWSMLYRLESDVPVPYGRIVPYEKPVKVPDKLSFKEKFELLVPNAKIKKRDVLVAIMSGNCFANKRYDYVTDLQKYIDVDFYGECGPENLKKACPFKGYGIECEHLQKYLFYLAFENSNCNGYVTEKFYTHALKHGAIPIVMGMYENQTELIAPPDSFIHVDNFKNPRKLAKYLLRLNETFEDNYLKFHEWRKHFYTTGEDGYMGNRCYHYCRVCEALNYNDESPKVYSREDLAVFLDPQRNCHDELEWN